jgi:hypothetical protein
VLDLSLQVRVPSVTMASAARPAADGYACNDYPVVTPPQLAHGRRCVQACRRTLLPHSETPAPRRLPSYLAHLVVVSGVVSAAILGLDRGLQPDVDLIARAQANEADAEPSDTQADLLLDDAGDRELQLGDLRRRFRRLCRSIRQLRRSRHRRLHPQQLRRP